MFPAYADKSRVLQSRALAVRFLHHPRTHGISLDWTLIQTDGFTRTIESFGAKHRSVPGCPNAQAKCESLHRRIEPEFFDIEELASPIDFWNKTAIWQNWQNFKRRNSAKLPPCDLTILLLPCPR